MDTHKKFMAVPRKVCLFSGKRGGLGAYLPLMHLIQADPELELQVLLGDMHASTQFGRTLDEAKKFLPNAHLELIEMGSGRGDTPRIRAENLGVCLQKAAGILERLGPDIILVHGDRGEQQIVAFAALNLGIPVAHTQGGEISGNIDEIQRHAITKLAHIHFPETSHAAWRIKMLGEEEWRIFVVGSTYIDRIAKGMYTDCSVAKKRYGLKDSDEYFIVIFHPETDEARETNYHYMQTILASIESFNVRVIVVYPCSDPGYEGILQAITEQKDNRKFLMFRNIDNLDFLGLMSGAQAIVGNSSAALIEAPYFKLPAINIGKRQMGRDREENVVDAQATLPSIREKIEFVLNDQHFHSRLGKCGYRIGDGQASEKILKVIKNIPVDAKLLQKRLTYD